MSTSRGRCWIVDSFRLRPPEDSPMGVEFDYSEERDASKVFSVSKWKNGGTVY